MRCGEMCPVRRSRKAKKLPFKRPVGQNETPVMWTRAIRGNQSQRSLRLQPRAIGPIHYRSAGYRDHVGMIKKELSDFREIIELGKEIVVEEHDHVRGICGRQD